MLLWLGSVNVILGVFNLVPGFPLDGGRVLRSLLWAVTGSLKRATRYASWAGRGIGLALIFMGISMAFGVSVPFFGSGIGGLWLAFIGWFLHNAAAQSYRQVVVHDILDGVSVGELVAADPPTVPASVSVSELVHDYIMRSDDHAFVVLDDGEFAGLVTLGDVRGVPRDAWSAKTVREIMTPKSALTTVDENGDSGEALTLLARGEFRQLPVLRGGRPVGLLRRRDVVRWLQFHADSETS
jgi:CBS domain-containing protein